MSTFKQIGYAGATGVWVLRLVSKGLLFASLIALFSPLLFLFSRSEASAISLVLVLLAILAAIGAGGFKKKEWVIFGSFVLYSGLTLFADLVSYGNHIAAMEFLYPLIELAVFYLLASYHKDSSTKVIALIAISLLSRELFSIYAYATGLYWESSYKFSDYAAYTEIAGILVQRPIDTAVSLFGPLALELSIRNKSKYRVLFFTIFVLSVLITLLSITRSLILAQFVAIGWVLIKYRLVTLRMFAFLAIGILVSVVTAAKIYPDELSLVETVAVERIHQTSTQTGTQLGSLRITEIMDALEQWSDEPGRIIFGAGLSGAIRTYERHLDGVVITNKQFIHNYHVLILFKLGLIGILIYAVFLVAIWRKAHPLFRTYLIAILILISFQPFVLAFHIFALGSVLAVLINERAVAQLSNGMLCTASYHKRLLTDDCNMRRL